MAEKVSTFQIQFDGASGTLESFLTALKGQVRSAVTELQAAANKLDLFANLEKDVAKAGEAFLAATERVAKLRQQMDALRGSGEPIGAELAKAFKVAENAAASLGTQYNAQAKRLDALGVALDKAGVDTSQLAKEQLRLAEALKTATAAAAQQSAKDALGFKSIGDVLPQINKLNAAFAALRDSGKLSFGELSVAQARLGQQIALIKAEVGGLGAAFTAARSSLLAFTVAFAGIGAGVATATKNFRDFAQQMAAIESIADTTKAKVTALGQQVRDLARVMGFDAVEGAKALYEILSSGVKAENAFTVLKLATEAAVAGITDVATAAKVGVAVINGYGLEITELAHVYDVLFQVVKEGVITFPEVAKNIGTVIPAARAAIVPIEELAAALVVLTRQGFDAPEAAVSINRAIIDLAAPAPEAAQMLDDLDIKLKGLTGTIEQLAQKKFNLNQITQIVPDVRAARAVLALVNNFELLQITLGKMEKSADTAHNAYLLLADTPQQQVAKFNAAMQGLSITVGEFVHGTGGLITSLTSVVNAFNELAPSTKTTVLQFTAMTAALTALVLVGRTLAIPINLLVGAFTTLGTSAYGASAGITALNIAMRAFGALAAGIVGLKIGEQLYENFAPVRKAGDVIGAVAAAVSNLIEGGFNVLVAKMFGTKKAVEEATAAFLRQRKVVSEQWNDAMTEASEKTRALAVEQARLVVELGKAATGASEAATALQATVSKMAAQASAQVTGIEQVIQNIINRLTQLNARLDANVALTQSLASSTIATINANVAAQIAALDNLNNSQSAIAAKTLALHQEQAAARLAALKQENTDALAAFEAAAAARIAIAKRTQENLQTVEREIGLQRKAVLASLVEANKAHVNDLIAQLTSYLNAVKAVELQRIAFNRTAEDAIRDIKNASLPAYQRAYEEYAAKISDIDRTISDARAALTRGDLTAAQDFAKQAIAASATMAKEIVVDGKVVVRQRDAEYDAIKRISDAQVIGNAAFKAQGDAAKEGAAKTKEALGTAETELQKVSKALNDVSALLKEGITLSIKTNVAAVEKEIATLDEKIAAQKHIVQIEADLKAARNALTEFQDELTRNPLSVTLKPLSELVERKLKEVEALNPEVTVGIKGIDSALKELETLKKKTDAITDIEMKITSNAPQVQKQIDKLKEPTSSTHTIKVVVTGDTVPGGSEVTAPGKARGGFVRALAGGGTVFASPQWNKVPGTGSGDTVPAALQAGSFVMRKAAAQFYGDGIMSKLARGYAAGGLVFDLPENLLRLFNPKQSPLIKRPPLPNQAAGGSEAGTSGNDSLASQLRKIVGEAYRVFDPLITGSKALPHSFWGQNLSDYLAAVLTTISDSRDPAAAQALLDMIKSQAAAMLASIAQAAKMRVPIVMGAMAPGEEGGVFKLGPRKAEGGPLTGPTDTVPAMLTPGEFVINRSRASQLGANFLNALNDIRIPREALSTLRGSTPMRVHGFAEGGAVGEIAAAGTMSASGGDVTVNLMASAADLFSMDNVRRYFVPVWRELQRKGQ